VKMPFPVAAPDDTALDAGRQLFSRGAEFLKGRRRHGRPAAGGPHRGLLRGQIERRQVDADQRADRAAQLARASNTPGRTQEINFFTLGETHYLVDLPGYGFANAPKSVVEGWQRLLRSYLAGRTTLRRAFVLVDARHGAKPVDEEIFGLLDKSAVPFQIVLTKADKIRASDLDAVLDQVRGAARRHPAAYPELLVTSSETGRGIDDLRAVIAVL
jgi:GTP-binding protein